MTPNTDNRASFQPRKVGRYLLHREIAHGGMATVHIGRLIGQVGFSRTVAIKRMHEYCARDPDFVSMFIDEARLAARIRHPNVVPTLDVVVLEGELFLVMEYVQGETLARLIRRSVKANQAIAPRVASSVIANVLEGLNAAHNAVGEHGEALGIVHRDVSPQNIMVGHDGVARVLDFGVAKATNRLQTTRDGQIKGKIEYMAPEQVRGGGVDRRTDVYSAACCLWEMLTGRRLYTADNQVVLWGKVLEGKVERPSAIVPSVPRHLEEVTMRGLDADPTKRYQTAEEMAIALETSVGIATPREVGRWVQSLAGQKLKERADLVAELESVSSEISSWGADQESASVISHVSARLAGPPAASSAPPPVPSGIKSVPSAAMPLPPADPPTPSAGRFVVPPPPQAALSSSPPAQEPVPEAAQTPEAAGIEPVPPAIGVSPDVRPTEQTVEPSVEDGRRQSVPKKRNAAFPIAAAVVTCVVVAAAVRVWLWPDDSSPASQPSTVASSLPTMEATQPPPEPELEAAVSTTSSSPQPKQVRLRIEVRPKGATVLLDDDRVDEREIMLPQSDEEITIVGRAPGYEPMLRKFVPSADGIVVLELDRKVTQPKPTATVEIKGPVETEL